jgi:hypothetical protein
MNDQRCVMIAGTGGCRAQNDPPCTYPTESWPAVSGDDLRLEFPKWLAPSSDGILAADSPAR